MALAGSNFSIAIPRSVGIGAAVTPAETSVLLDAASEYCGMVIRAPKAGTIKKVHFNTGTVTTGATLDVTIEGVSATDGLPDGTPLTNGTGTVVVADTDDNVQKTCTFTTGPTVTRGQLIAVRIANPAASFGNLNINANTSALATVYFPYSLSLATKVRNAPLIGLEYSDGSFGFVPNVFPITAGGFTSETLSASTTPDEVGIKFTLPFPVTVEGLWWHGAQATGQDITATLYSSDGSTVLESVAVDTEQAQTSSQGTKFILFTAGYDLLKDTAYRATLKPGATGVAFLGIQVATAAAMDAFEGGQNIHRTERTDSGAWTDTTTKRPWLGLLISRFDDGAGGAAGGGLKLVGRGGLAG